MIKFIISFGLLATFILSSIVKADESPIQPTDVVNSCTNGLAPCVNMVHIAGQGSIQADNSMIRGSYDDGHQLMVAFKEDSHAVFFCNVPNGKTTITFFGGTGTLSNIPPMTWNWYAEPGNKGLTGQHHNPMLNFIC